MVMTRYAMSSLVSVNAHLIPLDAPVTSVTTPSGISVHREDVRSVMVLDEVSFFNNNNNYNNNNYNNNNSNYNNNNNNNYNNKKKKKKKKNNNNRVDLLPQ